jgi:hypothetical protein
MNERGTYGRQNNLTNGYGSYGPYGLQAWNARPPMVGMEPEMRRAAMTAGVNALITLGYVLVGSWLGGKVTPDAPKKGKIVGGVTGYFASLLSQQGEALYQIAQNTANR